MSGTDDSDDAADHGRPDLDVEAGAYWQRLTEQVDTPQAPGTRRRQGMPDHPRETDPPENAETTDPTVLIVRTLLDNVAITKEMMDESHAARMAMAEAMRKTALQADTMSAEIRSVTISLQQLVGQQAAKWDRYIWAGVGFILGAVAMDASLITLPALWRQIFG